MSFLAWWLMTGALVAWLDMHEGRKPEDGASATLVVFILAMVMWPLPFLALCETLKRKNSDKHKKGLP